MTDRELISTAARIQAARGWSSRRLCAIAKLGVTTWNNVVTARGSHRLQRKTRATLAAFVAEWSDISRLDPRNVDNDLAATAWAIQDRRGWTDSYCAGLTDVDGNTWRRIVRRRAARFIHKPARAKLEAFIATWSDDTKVAPPTVATRRGKRFSHATVTREIAKTIIMSPLPAQVVSAQLGVSPSTVYRIRLRDRVMREAS